MSDEALFVDVEAVATAGAGLGRTFASAGWTAPTVPDVHHGEATQAIGDAATAVYGLACAVADQMAAAERALTTAAIEVHMVDDLGDEEWVQWPF
jgi:hypothetical protein